MKIRAQPISLLAKVSNKSLMSHTSAVHGSERDDDDDLSRKESHQQRVLSEPHTRSLL